MLALVSEQCSSNDMFNESEKCINVHYYIRRKGCQDLDIMETMRELKNSECVMIVSSTSSNQGIFVIVVK